MSKPKLTGLSQANLATLRTLLGLSESANPATIGAALRERVGSSHPASAPTSGLTLDADQAARLRAKLELGAGADAAAVVDAVAAVVDDSLELVGDLTVDGQPGQVTLSADAYQELSDRAALSDRFATSERDSYLDSRQDRFFPESRSAWERQYDLNPEMVRDYLDSAPVLMHAAATGAMAEETQDVTETDAYKEWKF